jgi:hypothetical protein
MKPGTSLGAPDRDQHPVVGEHLPPGRVVDGRNGCRLRAPGASL